ncbi:hypothetical protein DY000_02025487 [Brassica cretica]|uniref:Uncharacterized protein n=1 Tax=Brassica cretica TaxID=69181 RepID=A0ABQ7EDZ5_BRACR|nr:hypothetical protein DY000_02025487 [Brassica cretica]
MSTRIRSRQSSSATRISDDQMIDLVGKLRQFLPEIRERRRSDKVYYITSVSFNLFIYSVSIEGTARDMQLHKKAA